MSAEALARRAARYHADLRMLHADIVAMPGCAATLRNAGGKLYISVGMSPSLLDVVEARIWASHPKAQRTSGSYGRNDIDVTWRVNP